MKNEKGFVEYSVPVIVIVVILWFMFWFLPSLRIAVSEEMVSGIVYNNTNNAWISGNTYFSVRASEDTYVSEENRSSYCLPPSSPYIALVNKAAVDKSVKVIVTTKKMFEVAPAPWVCSDNVTVSIASKK